MVTVYLALCRYVITGSEQQHLEVRNSLLSYMSTIETYLVGYGRWTLQLLAAVWTHNCTKLH